MSETLQGMLAVEWRPPQAVPATRRPSVFLAGSIDMGRAEEWQFRAFAMLADRPIDVFNPRRLDWDASWPQDISHDGFRGQVEWELDHLERADLVLFHFDPAGRAPVTMMELGLHAASGKCVVSCPPGYWRRGNVQVLCARYGIVLHDGLAGAAEEIRDRLAGMAAAGEERA